MPVLGRNQSLYNPIWKKSPGQIKQGLQTGVELSGAMAPLAMVPAKIPAWLEALAPKGSFMRRMAGNDTKKVLDLAMQDRLGNVVAAERNPAKLGEVFDLFRHKIGGNPQAEAKYLKYVDRMPDSIPEITKEVYFKNIPPAGIPVVKSQGMAGVAKAFPQYFAVGAGSAGKTLKNLWQQHYSDMKFNDFVQKLKAKADSIVNNPAEAKENKMEVQE